MRQIVDGWSGSGFAARILIIALTGVAWSVSSLHQALFRPDYWNPVTAGDYFAVYAYTVAWLFTAVSLLVLREVASTTETISTAILVVAAGCLVAGVANALEDAVGIDALGIVYVTGAIIGGFGLLAIAAMLFTSLVRILTFVPAFGALAMMAVMVGGGVLALVAWLGFAAVLIRERLREAPVSPVDELAG